ncbi:hypothetical protein D3C76_1494640 [compost metagenome]
MFTIEFNCHHWGSAHITIVIQIIKMNLAISRGVAQYAERSETVSQPPFVYWHIYHCDIVREAG